MKFSTCSAFLGLALATPLMAQETISAPLAEPTAAVQSASPVVAAEVDSLSAVSESEERENFSEPRSAEDRKLAAEEEEIRAEIARLKLERELITERLALEAAQRRTALKAELSELEIQKDTLARQGELQKLRAENLAHELKTMQSEIARIETIEKREQFANSQPVYLEKPLTDDGMLVISDRRIALNGMITSSTADYITSRIHYWNNKNGKLPIFLVIDDCPGGSVMAGYRILKSMESSEAPVHVVVKSFAASMAACITTLAEESYAYPNAIILHHQISSMGGGRLNLTQQREFYEESQRWWQRLAAPVAEKMGISTDEFIKRMYEHSTSGDWSEFADRAHELKWVNHIVNGIEETSVIRHPDACEHKPAGQTALAEEVDAEGKPYAWLPRLNPKDCYFLYNPDGYFRTR